MKVLPGLKGKRTQRINIELINQSEIKIPKVDTSDKDSPLRNMCDYQNEQKKMFNSIVDPKLISAVPTAKSSHSPTGSNSP